jgi:hypothetical protein
MFRTISMVKLNADASAEELVVAARKIFATDPDIVSVEVGRGLKLLDHPLVPQASYSIIMSFNDQAGWRHFRQGVPHEEFQKLSIDKAEVVMSTQYSVDET